MCSPDESEWGYLSVDANLLEAVLRSPKVDSASTKFELWELLWVRVLQIFSGADEVILQELLGTEAVGTQQGEISHESWSIILQVDHVYRVRASKQEWPAATKTENIYRSCALGVFHQRRPRHAPGIPSAVENATLYLDLHLTTASIQGFLWYRSANVHLIHARRILSAFHRGLESILATEDWELSAVQFRALDLLSTESAETLSLWNDGTRTSTRNESLLGILHDQVQQRHDSLAVCAWDGNWSYQELDEEARRACAYLRRVNGVKAGDMVLFRANKSRWAVVALTAILYAGAACVPIDIRIPYDRLQQIQRITGASLLISTAETALLSIDSCQTVQLPLAESFQQDRHDKACIPITSPESTAFVFFTSGSTGLPKGVVSNHRSMATKVVQIARAMHQGPRSRTLQFASHSFDVSIGDIFGTFSVGGCVCVPSEQQRLDGLALTINDMQCTHACLTATTLSSLTPAEVPSLLQLSVGGESLTRDQLALWASSTIRLAHIYGTTESVIWDTYADGISTEDLPTNIGKAIGGSTWIVDASNPQRLVPVGAVGELVIEGPTIAKGYLNDPDRTATCFVDDPSWLHAFRPCYNSLCSRVYRTGDLARYGPDGSLDFLGRMDRQTKISGQRVELGDIEYVLQHALPPKSQCAVEYIQEHTLLAAFTHICHAHTAYNDAISTEVLRDLLAASLPDYMIPSCFIHLDDGLPVTPTGKLDRVRLRSIAASSSIIPCNKNTQLVEPVNEREISMRRLWAQVLGFSDPLSISLHDGFFHIGGSSVAAIKLVSLSRAQGIYMSVRDIYEHPRLCELVSTVNRIGSQSPREIPDHAFSLLEDNLTLDKICDTILQQSHMSLDQIEDIYPCTPLQEGLFALTAKQPGDYIGQTVINLPHNIVDPNRFQRAYEKVVAQLPILRTRFVSLTTATGRLYQLVVRESVKWQIAEDLEQCVSGDRNELTCGLGGPLVRSSLVQKGLNCYFVWTMHHSLFDGWSLDLMLDAITQEYRDQRITAGIQPFKPFLHYLKSADNDASAKFWHAELQGAERLIFPPGLPEIYLGCKSRKVLRSTAADILWPRIGSTPSTLMRGAWALLLHQYSSSEDVIFGAVTSGRQASMVGIENVVGPTIATVPFRVRFDELHGKDIFTFLHRMQTHSVNMLPFEQVGLQRISQLSADAARACQFQTLLVVHPAPTSNGENSFLQRDVRGMGDELHTYATVLQCYLNEASIDFQFQFDEMLMDLQQAERVLRHFQLVLHYLCSSIGVGTPLTSISAYTESDWREIAAWNQKDRPSSYESVMGSISRQAELRPDACAVDAWDGRWTYSELEIVSARIATTLISDSGLKQGQTVIVCTEKSRMAPVVHLGVLKSRLVCIMLDQSTPIQRINDIKKISQAEAAIVSKGQESRFQGYIRTFTIDQVAASNDVPCVPTMLSLSQKDLDAPAMLILTSGSTGVPKAIQWSHKVLAASAYEMYTHFHLCSATRLFQFSSYAFDVSIHESLATLVHGGCLCIPSEIERTDTLAQTILKTHSNMIVLTPSTGHILDPTQLSSLNQIVFCGSPLSLDLATRWKSYMSVSNWYGPAECSFGSVSHVDNSWTTNTIGYGALTATWVVDPDDHHRLLPIGAVGELLLEGPCVALGYSNSPKRSASSFISSTEWGAQILAPAARLYRTGDLVRYNANGSLVYVGRRDNQVKIRGQRVELQEIETQVCRALKGCPIVCAEVLKLRKNNSDLVLCAFVQRNSQSLNGEQKLRILSEDDAYLIKAYMQDVLPDYMIPSLYIAMKRLPETTSGKIDRRALQSLALPLLDSFHSNHHPISSSHMEVRESSPKTHPHSAAERVLQELWAKVLGLLVQEVRTDDHFIRLGGNSIDAMHLVALAHDRGYELSVKDVLTQPKLSAQAMQLMPAPAELNTHIAPFSMLSKSSDSKLARIEAATRCSGVALHQIEDIYPCAPLQTSLLALTSRYTNDYIHRKVYRIKGDTNRFKKAWQTLVDAAPILRTRIADIPNQGFCQIVLKEGMTWEETSHRDLGGYLASDRSEEMSLGAKLSRWAILPATSSQSESLFIWTIHHALFDGWSLRLILDQVERVYNGQDMQQLTPFNHFIHHISQPERISAAQQFWSHYLSGVVASTFPRVQISPSCQNNRVVKTVQTSFPTHTLQLTSAVTLPTVLKASWATVLSRYTLSEDVVFGLVVLGRQLPVRGIESIVGPTISSVPLRVLVSPDTSACQILQKLQSEAAQAIPFETLGLQCIRSLGEEMRQACQYETSLVIQPADEDAQSDSKNGLFDFAIAIQDSGSFSHTSLTLLCMMQSDRVSLTLQFDETCLDQLQAQRMLRHFEQAFQYLCRATPGTKMADLSLTTYSDMKEVYQWHGTYPESVDSTLDRLFEKAALRTPFAQAICAWDIELTFSALDKYSTTLARRLVSIGVRTQDRVPLCFEKSGWGAVAALGVIKAGGTCVMLDATQPDQRLRSLIQQLDSLLLITSQTNSDRALTLLPGGLHMTVNEDTVHSDATSHQNLPSIRPSDPLYISFTSGSTGTPKGVIITHGNFATAIKYRTSFIAYESGTRVLDTTSYSFDVAWSNLLTTLCIGSCLCIPRDAMNISAAMSRFQPTIVGLVPSVASLLDPRPFTSVRVLMTGGERVNIKDLSQWERRGIDIISAYGPAECTVSVSFSRLNGLEQAHLGKGVGATMWIVDPLDDRRLAPVGTPGELWLEGPQLGLGYLKDLKKTASSFATSPVWSPQSRRLYRTGDLVRYQSDGNVRFIGRLDDQIKLRGQRIELGEVEHYVRRCLPKDTDLAVEISTPDAVGGQRLLAFIQHRQSQLSFELALDKDENKISPGLRQSLDANLRNCLPPYMCPSAYIFLSEIPRLSSGKIDRKRLREMGKRTCLEDLVSKPSQLKRPPSTSEEKKLQHLWAKVFGVDTDCIGKDDNFLDMQSGDSISALRLVGLAREQQMSLTINDIFNHPKLCDLALRAKFDNSADETFAPFSFWPCESAGAIVKKEASEQCEVDAKYIEDAFPCTPMQEGLLALTTQDPPSYVARQAFHLHENINTDRLRYAWETVFAKTHILRTRIFDSASTSSLCQAVVSCSINWTTCQWHSSDVELGRQQFGLGTPLTYWVLIDQEDGSKKLSWNIHHALYDGWSIPIVLEKVERVYHRQAPRTTLSMQPFVRYLCSMQAAAGQDFWIKQLAGSTAPVFPQLPNSNYKPRASSTVELVVENVRWPSGIDTTPSAWIRAAWAILITRMLDIDHVIFGATVSGRYAPVRAIEHVVGPTITTVPIRICLDRAESIRTFVSRTHSQSVDMIPYEQYGLQNIRKISGDAELACQFQVLLNVEQRQIKSPNTLWTRSDSTNARGGFDSYALIVDFELDAEAIAIRADFDDYIVPHQDVERMLDQFKSIIRQLGDNSLDIDSTVGTVEAISLRDLHDIWSRNATVPEEMPVCLDKIIAQRVVSRPDSVAVDAWDGQFTYAQLDSLSSALAYDLQSKHQIGDGCFVPLCFEKSCWTVVALLAVMKAGGAFAMMDVGQPKERLRMMVRKSAAGLILSSSGQEWLARQLSDSVAVIDEKSLSQMEAHAGGRRPSPKASPRSPLYLVFTSGSTGIPKGVVITHANFSSAVKHQQNALHYDSNTRVFDFASYSFDISVSNVLHSLAAGGCLCVPSETQRQEDLAGTMKQMRVNLIDLTPSVARTIDPESVTGLEILVFGGEVVRRSDINQWSPYVTVLNGIGQAECTVTTTMASMDPKATTTPDIGTGVGANTWIVDPSDHESLAGFGHVGELLVEGPLVGAGYLDDPEKTEAVFIQAPRWLRQGGPYGHPSGRTGRLYKTGDLVKYNIDGTLQFLGRKDAQTKIRGQRIELEEVEHHIRRFLRRSESSETMKYDLTAEVVLPRGGQSSVLLVFMTCTAGGRRSAFEVMDPAHLPKKLRTLNQDLAEEIPSAMVPLAYIPVSTLPLSATGKIDRKKLQAAGARFTVEELAKFSKPCLSNSHRVPSLASEKQIQGIWSEILGVDRERIGADHNFLQLGGDSIMAMRVVSLAKRRGLSLRVAEVLSHSSLSALVGVARPSQGIQEEIVIPSTNDSPPFSMLQKDNIEDFVKAYIVPHVDGHRGSIENAYPVTGFQERSIRGALQEPPAYWNYFYMNLGNGTDMRRLRQNIEAMVQQFAILRSVFIPFKRTFLQVITQGLESSLEEVHDDTGLDLVLAVKSFCSNDWRSIKASLGQQFARLFVLTTASGQMSLIIRMSHAQYDGISLSLMAQTMSTAYNNSSLLETVPYSSFIQHSLSLKEESLQYWHTLLQGSSMTPMTFPHGLNNITPQSTTSSYKLHRTMKWTPPKLKNATVSSILCACWASVIATYTHQHDIVFGRIVAGRVGSQLPNIENVAGPCVNVVPVRATWTPRKSASPPPRSSSSSSPPLSFPPNEIYESLHLQQLEATSHETTSLSDITDSSCMNWPSETDFGSIFQYQNIEEVPLVTLGERVSGLEMVDLEEREFEQQWLLVKPRLGENGAVGMLEVSLAGPAGLMGAETAEWFVEEFCRRVRELAERLGEERRMDMVDWRSE